ncbi:VOC family protein [Spartinivicinus ruber]|uniref:VOC family protein n=1 Tax=Spartinivicinus ruber TaxID=2683272 RepID=UPI0013CFC8AD|nr:VOC family protein [Spartinivicinus ruber]
MYLEHVNLVVSNIPKVLAFYQAAFPHWKIRTEGSGHWNGKPRNWIHFGDDYHYIAFSDHGKGENRNLEGHQVGFAHFAYVTNSIETTISRLKSAGFEIHKEGVEEPYRKNVYFLDPAGYEVEFVEYLSDIPEQRNLTR